MRFKPIIILSYKLSPQVKRNIMYPSHASKHQAHGIKQHKHGFLEALTIPDHLGQSLKSFVLLMPCKVILKQCSE